MARNRKRRADRRPSRAAGSSTPQPGVATARATRRDDPHREETPAPIEHAAPDAELAEAQLAMGRSETAADDAPLSDAELEQAERADELAGTGNGRGALAVNGSGGAAEIESRRSGGRLIHFLQGSWRELQRVQWPDRRQVMQATGVVIGFVIVAGVFLGVADFVATRVVNLILK
jgi:preprotein translocase subunit SecE